LFGASASASGPSTSASISTSASAPPTSALPCCSELQTYLDSDLVSQFDDSFSILSWLHDYKRTYHVLSILAKDIWLFYPLSLQSLLLVCVTGNQGMSIILDI
jgi:hypothetical protein